MVVVLWSGLGVGESVAVVVVDDDSDDEGFTVTAEWVLPSVLVLELVMELMRLPASFLVMVAGA